jgi:hypothetical protein
VGALLLLAGYAAYAAFLGRAGALALALARAPADPGGTAGRAPSPARAYAAALLDILLLLRLLRTNAPLWALEWVFHLCVALEAARHLRYLLEPVPAWAAALQAPGLAAGYLLPAALLAILAAKWRRRGSGYYSSENVLLLALLLLGAGTGIALKHLAPTDLVAAKSFMLGFFAFRPGAAPASPLFAAHLLLAFLVLARLPAHVATAPFAILDANRRDAALRGILHE